MDDIDIFVDSFNSNWTCGCKSRTRKYIPSPVSNEYRLIINHHNTDEKYNDIYLEDFDVNFDLYHSLKPNFKYYETHQFHSVKDKTINTFSLFHTIICSLQYNGDNLHNLLASLEFKFDIIALSETWNPK